MAFPRTANPGRFLILAPVLAVLLLLGAWGLWTSQAMRQTSRSLWEPEYEDLRSPDPEVRAKAVQSIRVARDSRALPVLLLYLADPDQKVGLYLAQTLGSMAEEDVLAALRAALWDVNANIRWRAALALGERGDARAVPRLAQLLYDPDRLVRHVAANALAQIATPEAAEALAAALASQDQSVVYNARRALLQLGEDAVPALSAVLASGSPSARRDAATVLGYIASPLATPALQRAARDADAQVRNEAVWALGEIQRKRNSRNM